MSIVCLQFGQCGNQIGESLYSTVAEDVHSNNSLKNVYNYLAVDKWFEVNKANKWEPRSVVIDTENKVVSQHTKSSPFVFKNIIAKSYGGSANNWAYGYTRRSEVLNKEVLNTVQSEVEKCDYLSSFLNIYSSSGGTGSGVGSSIIEQLREEYPSKNVVNAIVLPYVKGEVVTQSYNSLLTLSHLYSVADSTILFENERLHYVCKYTLNIEDVQFSNMNAIIAQQLAAVYQPINNVDSVSLLSYLTSHPMYKFLHIRSEPNIFKDNLKFESSRQWKALVTTVSKQPRFDFLHQKHVKLKNKVISSALIARGCEPITENDIKPLREANTYVPWLTGSNSFSVYHQKRNFINFDKYLTTVTNSNSVCVPLNHILDDAWKLFTHGAYLHHYKKYNVDEDTFLNSFQSLENVLDHYKMTASWDYEDKRNLLLLLQQHGASDLELIQQKMPHKSLAEIRYMCDKHSKLALSKWCTEESKNGLANKVIKDWLQILKQLNSLQRGSVHDIIPRVLKYIALYEKRIDSSQVWLRDCYLVLSDISNGLACKYLNESSHHFFFECLTKLAEALKNGETESYKRHLRYLENLNDLIKNQIAVDKKEPSVLNPLNVPSSLLKMTEVDKLIDIFE